MSLENKGLTQFQHELCITAQKKKTSHHLEMYPTSGIWGDKPTLKVLLTSSCLHNNSNRDIQSSQKQLFTF